MRCTCKQCGKVFELSDSEIDFYRNKKLNLPKRCKECRQANKQKQGKPSQGTDKWNAGNQYDAASGQDNKKISRWVYGLIAAVILLLVPGIKASRDYLMTPRGEELIYSADDGIEAEAEAEDEKPAESVKSTQDELVDSIESSQGADSDVTELTQNESVNEPEMEQIEPEAPADLELNDAVSSAVIKQYAFRNAKLLEEHYQKHGIEMGYASMEEYQAAASAVVNNTDSLHKFEAEDGDDVYYLEATNDFVIVSTDGYIRTYFRPDIGIEYYNKQ